jgi:hypothetical protein
VYRIPMPADPTGDRKLGRRERIGRDGPAGDGQNRRVAAHISAGSTYNDARRFRMEPRAALLAASSSIDQSSLSRPVDRILSSDEAVTC